MVLVKPKSITFEIKFNRPQLLLTLKLEIMNSLKNVLSAVGLFFAFSLTSMAQNGDLQGVSLHATEYTLDLESSDKYDENQIFTFSFRDKILVHQLMNGDMTVQVYAIINVEFTSYDGFVLYKTTVKSGLSGKEYTYNIFVLNDDNSVIIEYDGVYYMGRSAFVRSFKQ
jgi:hypothetical protein